MCCDNRNLKGKCKNLYIPNLYIYIHCTYILENISHKPQGTSGTSQVIEDFENYLETENICENSGIFLRHNRRS